MKTTIALLFTLALAGCDAGSEMTAPQSKEMVLERNKDTPEDNERQMELAMDLSAAAAWLAHNAFARLR